MLHYLNDLQIKKKTCFYQLKSAAKSQKQKATDKYTQTQHSNHIINKILIHYVKNMSIFPMYKYTYLSKYKCTSNAVKFPC